jgi:orotate phosphoribosyltransferase
MQSILQATPAFQELVFRHLHVVEGGRSFGPDHVFRVERFVDLLSAAHVERDLHVMTAAIAQLIGGPLFLPESVDTVVGPKRGNSLLIRALAQHLGLASMYVKTQPLFGYWLEGVFEPSANCILVDDLASDGEFLVETVERVRERGHRLTDAYFLLVRTDTPLVATLEDANVRVHALCAADDRQLASLATRRRAGR